jgi:hypothetical protein
MFWNNLSPAEADEYRRLTIPIKLWVAYWAMKERERPLYPPKQPSDQDFITHELLAMKGWGMIPKDQIVLSERRGRG